MPQVRISDIFGLVNISVPAWIIIAVLAVILLTMLRLLIIRALLAIPPIQALANSIYEAITRG